MQPTIKYRCEECLELHDLEYRAVECCPPQVTEVYFCRHCGESYDFDEEAADGCCDDADPDAPPFVSHAELEAAGQMRLSV